jgi:hypothetical protein
MRHRGFGEFDLSFFGANGTHSDTRGKEKNVFNSGVPAWLAIGQRDGANGASSKIDLAEIAKGEFGGTLPSLDWSETHFTGNEMARWH